MKLFEMNAIHTALRNVTRSVTVTRQRVQQLAEQAVAYSIIYGDISVGIKLIEAISVNKSLRKDSLVAYLEKFGNFSWSKQDKKLSYFPAITTGSITPEHELAMTTMTWDAAKREAEITSVRDMEDEVRRFIDRMHKLTGDAGLTIENRAALDVVEQSFARWSAENTLKAMKADQDAIEAGEQAEAIAKAKAEAEAKTEEPVQIPTPVLIQAAA